MSEFLLPYVGEGLTEAEIVAWKVKVGDTVEINDVIVEIETAKSLVELPSPFEGTVLALLVPEGETVPVGTPIISIGAEGEAPPAPTPAEQTESDPYLGMAEKAGAAEVSAQVDAADRLVEGGEADAQRLDGEPTAEAGEDLLGVEVTPDRRPVVEGRVGVLAPDDDVGEAEVLAVDGVHHRLLRSAVEHLDVEPE